MHAATPEPAPVRYRLLGPMEIVVDGRLAPLPGAAERALLALLLLSAGKTVPATSLIDRLWAEASLPADPMNALQVRVSKLRKAMAVLGLDVVRREGIGYRATVDPSEIDVEEFAKLVRAARDRAAVAEEPTRANLEAYDEALALWRGEPLSDFVTETWATTEASRLTELRWAALTERAHLALALGHHAELVAELEPLVQQDPAREAIAGVLMVALYRSGRQADALDVYGRIRLFLDESLGLEPSASLRSLHERVLRQDDSLGAEKELRLAPAPAKPDREVRTNLPSMLQPLIGRAEQQAAVHELIGRAHLVSLVGPGGAGKTTLARATAVAQRARFVDGCVEVRLAAVREPDQVAVAVADALGMSIDGAAAVGDVREKLARYLANRRLLLVLDNCEHVVDAVAVLVDELLGRCPDVTVLATSREALGIAGEHQVLVGPLETPPDNAVGRRAADYPAVQLFLERATAVRSGIALDDDDHAAVADICRALDGMPLAIELAAARVASLSVTEIADRLSDRFALLTSGSRTAEKRQRTLRAAVDWSYTLLEDNERTVFDRLSVFHGGFTLSGAEAVVTGDDISSAEVLHIIGRLVAQSLLAVEPARTSRYGMLETLREYASERLHSHHGVAEFARRHADYFAGLVESHEAALRGHGQREAVARIREEHANIRAALAFLDSPDGDRDAALRMAGSLGLFWHLGRHLEGREMLRDLLTHDSGSPDAVARALQAVSLVERPRACLVHPSPRCAETAETSLRLFEQVGDRSRAALSRVLLAVEGVTGTDTDRAEALLAEAEAEFRREEDEWGLAIIGFVRMETALKHGDENTAVSVGQAAAASFRQLDDPWGLSAVMYHLGWGLRQFGRHQHGARVLEEAIDVAASARLDNTVQWALGDLGIAHLNLGDIHSARDSFDRARAVSENVGDGAGAVLADYGYALLAQTGGDWDEARRRYQAAEHGFEQLRTPVATGLAVAGSARCDEHAGDLEAARERYEEVEEVGRSAGEPGLVAAACEGLSRVAEATGGEQEAQELAAEADRLRQESLRPAPVYEQFGRQAVDSI